MGPSLVVVLEPLSQDALKVPTIEDQEPVQTLAPGRANLALDVRICLGAAISVHYQQRRLLALTGASVTPTICRG
jgi:hypothetical protein